MWRRNSRDIIFIMLQNSRGGVESVKSDRFLEISLHNAQIIRNSVFLSLCLYRKKLMAVLSCVYNVHVVPIMLVCANLFGVSVWVRVLGKSVKCVNVFSMCAGVLIECLCTVHVCFCFFITVISYIVFGFSSTLMYYSQNQSTKFSSPLLDLTP